MPRDIAVLSAIIDNQLATRLAAEGVNLSSSTVAEWKLWRDVLVDTIYGKEVIEDAFKLDLETFIQTKQPASIYWYVQKALEFQYGDTLSVSAEGVLYYANIDATKQIVRQASVREVDNSGYRTLLIKVAKQNITGDFIPLEATEKLAFEAYMETIKWAGTNLIVTSQTADTIGYALTIKYNGIYAAEELATRVATALQAFKEKRIFDAIFYASSFLDWILKVDGVIAAKFTGLVGTPHAGTPIDITLDYQLQSGYFNYDLSSTMTFQLP